MSYVQPNSSSLMGLECDFNVVSASMYKAQKRLLGEAPKEHVRVILIAYGRNSKAQGGT